MPALSPEDSERILVTGATGYIGSWLTKLLLERGYRVRAAVRSEGKSDPLREYFASYVDDGRLEFVIVEDFAVERAFDEAVVGVDGIIHMAAPLTSQSDDPDEFIKPVVNGTMNILKAASRPESTIKRIVITSSTASVSRTLPSPTIFDENDWANDPELLAEQGRAASMMVKYRASKTISEKAAWEYSKQNKPWDLVVLNPPFVFGPPLIRSLPAGTSVDWWFGVVIKDVPKDSEMLKGARAYVDVRDVAEAHVRSLLTPEAGGERIILSAGVETWQEAIDYVNSLENLPHLKTKMTRGTPGLEKVYMLQYNNDKSKRILGPDLYRTREETVRDMLKDMSDRGL